MKANDIERECARMMMLLSGRDLNSHKVELKVRVQKILEATESLKDVARTLEAMAKQVAL